MSTKTLNEDEFDDEGRLPKFGKEPMAGWPPGGPRSVATPSNVDERIPPYGEPTATPVDEFIPEEDDSFDPGADALWAPRYGEKYIEDRYGVKNEPPKQERRGPSARSFWNPIEGEPPKSERPSVPYYSNPGGTEPIDLIHDLNLDFDEGNIVKYVSRWRKKGGVADLYKARTYLTWLIERAEAAEEKDEE